MKTNKVEALQQELQENLNKKFHVITVGFCYAIPIFCHALVLALVAFTFKTVRAPFLFYILALAFGEFLIQTSFKERLIELIPTSMSSKKIKINWPINSETYKSFFWIALDAALDFLLIRWALTSALPHILLFPLFFGTKSIGMVLQASFSYFQSINRQLFTSLFITCIVIYWIVCIIELKPTPLIVLVAVILKGLMGNFLSLARAKLALNAEVSIEPS